MFLCHPPSLSWLHSYQKQMRLFIRLTSNTIKRTNGKSMAMNDHGVLCREGPSRESLDILHVVDGRGISLDSNTYASLLQASAHMKSLSEGKQIHTHLLVNGLGQHEFLGTKLVSAYSVCGSLMDARMVFEQIPQQNVFLWNSMIRGYARHGLYQESLLLYCRMRQAEVKPDAFTFSCVLKACAGLSVLQHGKEVQTCIIKGGLESHVFVGNALVAMYAKCGSLQDALQVFDKMSERDAVSWNAIIAGYAQRGHAGGCFEFFYLMHISCLKPDSVTIVSILPVCGSMMALPKGKEIHGYVVKSGLRSDESVGNALLSMYSKCGRVEDARHVFDELPQRDIVAWNAMITGYGQNGYCDEALKLFQLMISLGLKLDVITWCAVIAALVQNGRPEEALELFNQMQLSGVKPDRVTISSVVPACGQIASLQLGKEIHDYIRRNGFESELSVANALVDMYAKCGSIERSRQVFDKISDRDVISWSAMIGGYAQNGIGEEALTLFKLMCQADIKPNSITVTSVLSACASISALQPGKEIHCYIVRSGLESHVFVESALIDMYAKCGRVEIAHHVFDKMSRRNVVSWNAMIGGYAMHGRGADALALFSQMQQTRVMPDQITFIVILSACSHAGLMDEGWYYFNCMSQEYCITPKVGHYTCMVDLLGRAGQLDEALHFINQMPLEPNADVWGSLLGACRIHCNIELGQKVAEHLFELQPENPGFYVLMSNIYAAAGRWDDVTKVRTKMKERGLRKRPGCSWIEVKNKVHTFIIGDRSHPHVEKIYAMLDHLAGQMEETGYVPDKNFVLHEVEEEEK